MTGQELQQLHQITPEEKAKMKSFKDFKTGADMIAVSTLVTQKYAETFEKCSHVVVEHEQEKFMVQVTDTVPVDAQIVIRESGQLEGVSAIVSG